MLVVIAKIRAKDEHADEVAGALTGMVEWVGENEPETLSYSCNRVSDDRNVFVIFERYTGQEAFQAHSASERFAELVGEMQGKLDGGIEIQMLEEVAAKL